MTNERILIMKKGSEYIGYVDHVNFPNKGTVWVKEEDGTKIKVTVKDVLPGQTIKFRALKTGTKKEGQLLEVVCASDREGRKPPCPHFMECGGCSYQSMPYKEQLRIKEEQVRQLLDDAVKGEYIWEGILHSPQEFHYRNKMEFSFGDEFKDGPLTLGMHKRGSFYDIITTDNCQIVDKDFNLILKSTLEIVKKYQLPFYHKISHKGFLRHLLVRRAVKTGEILIHLVTTSNFSDTVPEEQEKRELEGQQKQFYQEFFAEWKEAMLCLPLSGSIKGILHLINNSLADIVTAERIEQLYGENFFYEDLLGLKFRISSFSFFQTNSLGAEVLYQKAREYVGETKDKVIFDLYSGTGTIAQLLALVAEKVIGIEIVEEAVLAAKENAKENGLENCEFITGDVLRVLDELTDKPDYIVLDPPRDGVHPKALQKIGENIAPEKIIYISCKPTSLARDLIKLQEYGYRVERACCVDMFPQTRNVETVCYLTRIK